jgi:hypothetical protein
MYNIGFASVDVEAWTLVNCLEEGGFPALLWDTLKDLGYTAYPEYSTRVTPNFRRETRWISYVCQDLVSHI